MIKILPEVMGLMDTLNEWNEKLNAFAAKNMDSVLTGTLIIFVIVAVGFWAIGALNKK